MIKNVRLGISIPGYYSHTKLPYMVQTIDCKVAPLATKDKSKLIRLRDEWLYDDTDASDLWIPQHLYFTSDEEIKEGEYFLWQSAMTSVYEVYKYHSDAGYGIKTYTNYSDKDGSSVLVNHSGYRGKIVALTNQSLGLPTIPKSFIQKYVAANGKIDIVKLEM